MRSAIWSGRARMSGLDLMRARRRLGKLLRHDIRYDGAARNWTTRHRDWLGRVELGDRGAQVTLLDHLGAMDALVVRRAALEATIAVLSPARHGRRPSPGCAVCVG